MDVKNWKPFFQKMLSRDKGVKLLMVLGLCGIVLIYLSSVMGSSAKKDSMETEDKSDFTALPAYEEKLEQSLSEIVGAITGETSPTVMVTLEKGKESVYASDEKTRSDMSEGGSREQEKTYVILKDSDGSQYALSVTEIQPEVKGVVIVSKSAEDPVIRERLVNAAKTALGISSSRVCVTCGR